MDDPRAHVYCNSLLQRVCAQGRKTSYLLLIYDDIYREELNGDRNILINLSSCRLIFHFIDLNIVLLLYIVLRTIFF